MLSVKNKVNARLQLKLKTETSAPYHSKTLYFSSTKQNTAPDMPCLNCISLGEPQTANDLERKTQVAIISTIELKGYASDNYTSAFTLVDKAGDIMLSMGYELIAGIEDISDTSAKIAFARFRRTVGSGDFLY